MKIKTIRKPKVFIPEFNGNKELAEEDQITVNIKSFPTVTEAKGYRNFRASEGGGVELVYSNDSIMLTRHIGSIKNLEIDGGDEEIIVNNGSTLAKCKALELADLISEIRDFLLESSELVEPGES